MKIRDAKVCLDCDEVFPIHLESCPKCGSMAFAWLAGWVKPIQPAASDNDRMIRTLTEAGVYQP